MAKTLLINQSMPIPYENIRKIATDQEDDYTHNWLLARLSLLYRK